MRDPTIYSIVSFRRNMRKLLSSSTVTKRQLTSMLYDASEIFVMMLEDATDGLDPMHVIGPEQFMEMMKKGQEEDDPKKEDAKNSKPSKPLSSPYLYL